MIVVTTTPHVARTRYIFDKCYPGEFTVVAAGSPKRLRVGAPVRVSVGGVRQGAGRALPRHRDRR